jgi:hypothetical protein
MRRKKQGIIIIVLVLFLIVSLVVLKDYRTLINNHNATTSGLIQVTKESMSVFIETAAVNDITLISDDPFNDIYNNIRLLELSLRDASFTENSIEKEKFYDFIYELTDVGGSIFRNDILVENKELKDNLVSLFELFQQQKDYGTSSPNLFGVSKVIIIYENDTWDKLESLLSNIEIELNY